MGHVRRWLFWRRDRQIKREDDGIKYFFLQLIDEQKCSHSYVNQAISALKLFWEEILNKAWSAQKIRRPKKETRLPRVLGEDEVAALINALTNLKHRSIMMLLYSAGLRVGEVVRLKASDIDSSRMLVLIRSGKGAKDRVSPMWHLRCYGIIIGFIGHRNGYFQELRPVAISQSVRCKRYLYRPRIGLVSTRMPQCIALGIRLQHTCWCNTLAGGGY